jgi:hypothetical protein
MLISNFLNRLQHYLKMDTQKKSMSIRHHFSPSWPDRWTRLAHQSITSTITCYMGTNTHTQDTSRLSQASTCTWIKEYSRSECNSSITLQQLKIKMKSGWAESMQAVIPANMSIIKEIVSPTPSCGQWRPWKERRGRGLAGPAAQAMEKPHGSPVKAYNHLDKGRQKL